jgi:hypothetical protein
MPYITSLTQPTYLPLRGTSYTPLGPSETPLTPLQRRPRHDHTIAPGTTTDDLGPDGDSPESILPRSTPRIQFPTTAPAFARPSLRKHSRASARLHNPTHPDHTKHTKPFAVWLDESPLGTEGGDDGAAANVRIRL